MICFTISQNNTLNLLQFVLLLELRKNLMKTYKCFVQGSTRQTHTSGDRVTGSVEVTKCFCTPPDVDHLMFQLLTICLAGQKIHQGELFMNSKKILFLLIRRSPVCWFDKFLSFIVNLRFLPLVRESIHLKRNGYFLTEPDQIVELLDCVKHHTAHRTTPVKDEDQTMVLTIRNYRNFLE
jgi:hypothetical protein